MANVIARVNKPTLVIAPNKTLAAQLYNEFRELFAENAVRYFVSYYDYYQPEAYVPSTDTYIEKDASINDEIDKLRHSATRALLERRDTLIVASVSCIYGLGSPEAYFDMMVYLEEGTVINRDQMLRKLVDIQYQRSDYDFHRGTFRVRGDIVEIFPAYEDSSALRIEFFDDTVEAIREIDPIRGKVQRRVDKACIYPASHYVTGEERMKEAVRKIRLELGERLRELARGSKVAGSATAGAAHLVRSRAARRNGFLSGHRKLLAPPDRPQARRAAADALELLSQRLSADHRRKPCDRAADRRHVPRRPLAQGNPGRIWFSFALGAR